MKSLFIVLSVLILTLIYSSPKAEAACPTGYTSSYTSIINSSGCLIQIEYCYLEISPGIFEIKLGEILISPSCVNTVDVTDNNFWIAISNKIANDFPESLLPNCPTSITNIIIEKSYCTKYVNDIQNAVVRIVQCDDETYCKSLYRICMNRNVNPHQRVVNYLYSVLEGNSSCNAGPVDFEILFNPFTNESVCYSACILQ